MDTSNAFVLDSLVTMAWGFDDEDDAYAVTILDKLHELQAYVPSLWSLEVANALIVGERRGRSTSADSARFLAILGTFPIVVDDETVARAWTDSLHLARAHDLSAYDAAYLEPAIRRGLPLACLDGKLKAGAIAAGVPLFTPS